MFSSTFHILYSFVSPAGIQLPSKFQNYNEEIEHALSLQDDLESKSMLLSLIEVLNNHFSNSTNKELISSLEMLEGLTKEYKYFDINMIVSLEDLCYQLFYSDYINYCFALASFVAKQVLVELSIFSNLKDFNSQYVKYFSEQLTQKQSNALKLYFDIIYQEEGRFCMTFAECDSLFDLLKLAEAINQKKNVLKIRMGNLECKLDEMNNALKKLTEVGQIQTVDINQKLSQLTKENSTLNEKVFQLTQENFTIMDKLSQLTEENSTLRDKVSQFEEENSTLKDKVSQLTKENSALTDKVFQLTKENSALKDRISALEEENSALKDRISALEGEKATLSAEIYSLKEEDSLLLKQHKESEERIRVLIEENITLKEIISSQKGEITQLKKKVEENKIAIQQNEQNIKELTIKLQKKEKDIEQLEIKNKKLKGILHNKNSIISELEKEKEKDYGKEILHKVEKIEERLDSINNVVLNTNKEIKEKTIDFHTQFQFDK